MINPTMFFLKLRMLRAARFVVYPRLSITERIRSCVSLATSTLPFKTRETVDTETPAFFATSWIVTDRLFFRISSPLKSDRIAVSLPVTIPLLLHIPGEKSTFFKKQISGRNHGQTFSQ